MDVECFKSPEPFLAGFDLVFQSEFREGRDINNAVMAGVPGHPFWMQVGITHMPCSILHALRIMLLWQKDYLDPSIRVPY